MVSMYDPNVTGYSPLNITCGIGLPGHSGDEPIGVVMCSHHLLVNTHDNYSISQRAYLRQDGVLDYQEHTTGTSAPVPDDVIRCDSCRWATIHINCASPKKPSVFLPKRIGNLHSRVMYYRDERSLILGLKKIIEVSDELHTLRFDTNLHLRPDYYKPVRSGTPYSYIIQRGKSYGIDIRPKNGVIYVSTDSETAITTNYTIAYNHRIAYRHH